MLNLQRWVKCTWFECVSGEIFKIAGQAAAAIKPREGAFDNPRSRQMFKPSDDFDFEVRQDFG